MTLCVTAVAAQYGMGGGFTQQGGQSQLQGQAQQQPQAQPQLGQGAMQNPQQLQQLQQFLNQQQQQGIQQPQQQQVSLSLRRLKPKITLCGKLLLVTSVHCARTFDCERGLRCGLCLELFMVVSMMDFIRLAKFFLGCQSR